MKKIIVIASSLIIAFSLTACGNGSDMGDDISDGMSKIESAAESATDDVKSDVKSGVDSATAKISENEAKAAALKHAGVEEKDITGFEIHLDREDGALVYEIEFVSGDTEYSYDVDAETGKVTDRDRDRLD